MPRMITPKPEPTPEPASTFHKIDTDLCDLTEVDGDNLSSYTSNGWKVAAVMQGQRMVQTRTGHFKPIQTTIYLVGRNLEAALEDRMKFDARWQKEAVELNHKLVDAQRESEQRREHIVDLTCILNHREEQLAGVRKHIDQLVENNRRYEEIIGRLRFEFGDAAIRKAIGEE